MSDEGFALEQFILLIGATIWMCGFRFMRRRKLLASWCAGVLGGLCLLFFALLAFDHFLFRTLPNRRDLRNERKEVAARVLKAGGWKALEAETRKLLDEFPDGGAFQGSSEYPALSSLQARRIEIWPIETGGHYLLITFFGWHSTGGRGVPYYSLLITTHTPQSIDQFSAFQSGRQHMQNVTNSVYEVFVPY